MGAGNVTARVAVATGDAVVVLSLDITGTACTQPRDQLW